MQNLAKLGQVAIWLSPYLKNRRGMLAVMVLSGFVLGMTSVAGFYLLQYFIDTLMLTKQKELLWAGFGAYFGAVVLNGVCRWFYAQKAAAIQMGLSNELKFDLFSKYQRLPLTFFFSRQTGTLVNQMTSETAAIERALQILTSMIKDVFLTIAFIVTAYKMGPTHTALALLPLPLVGALLVYWTKNLPTYSRRIQEAKANANHALLESVASVRITRVFQREEHEISKYKELQRKIIDASMAKVKQDTWIGSSYSVLNVVGTSLVFVLLADDVMAGKSTPGSFIAFILAVSSMFRPVSDLFAQYGEILSMHGTGEQVFQTLNTETGADKRGGQHKLEGEIHDLAFENISFSYSTEDDPVLSGVTVKMRSGEVTAILGRNGAGKTTMLNLVPRLLEPSAGLVKINGRDIREYDLQSLRSKIAMVGQETALLDGTIFENIAYGKVGASEAEVREAARAAFAHEFIEELPRKYETRIGERGGRLSRGQQQRIAIARAYLKDAPILLLDEPTTALDAASQEAVFSALKGLMKGRIVLIVTHQLSILPESGVLLRLEGGTIAESKVVKTLELARA